MKVPPEITFRNIEKTEAVKGLIQKQVGKLEKVCNYLSSCRIAVEKRNEHQRSGNPYRVRIDLTVAPSHKLAVRREPGEGRLHDDLCTVIRTAFDAARRQLQKLVERQRGDVKTHPEQEIQGIVASLMREKGFGFVRSVDGRDVYFHKHSVLSGDFDRLEVGTGVRFVAEEGEKGPQASTVQIVDKRGGRGS